jgi:hypothetical protein
VPSQRDCRAEALILLGDQRWADRIGATIRSVGKLIRVPEEACDPAVAW